MKMGVGHLLGRKTPKREEYTSPDKNNILSTLNSLESEQKLKLMIKEAENTNIKCKVREIESFSDTYHLRFNYRVNLGHQTIAIHFNDSFINCDYDYSKKRYEILDLGQGLPTLLELVKSIGNENLKFMFEHSECFSSKYNMRWFG